MLIIAPPPLLLFHRRAFRCMCCHPTVYKGPWPAHHGVLPEPKPCRHPSSIMLRCGADDTMERDRERKEATLHAQHLQLCRAVSAPHSAACASPPHEVARSLAFLSLSLSLSLARSLACARALSLALSQTRKGAFGPDERRPVTVLCQQVQRVVKKMRGSKLRARAPERSLHHRQLGCECRVAQSDREGMGWGGDWA
jgi:hypothetical protein